MNEVTKNLHCIVIRGDIRLWIDSKKLDAFRSAFSKARANNTLVDIGSQSINPADVMGVFNASTLEETTRRRNGQFQCISGEWHDKRDVCRHKVGKVDSKTLARIEATKKAHGF